MSSELWILSASALTIGVTHTALGPDHYLPFVALARARGWSMRRTLVITAACGFGHVGSSVLLGLLGIGLGISLQRLDWIEAHRGDLASWMLIGFGLVYGSWGWMAALRNRPHRHFHVHADGKGHLHRHTHHGEHAHPHQERGSRSVTPWILFLVFVFGPCEPLIPLLLFPAAGHHAAAVAWVALLFLVATLATMLAMVTTSLLGLSLLPRAGAGRYAHALAGSVILLAGLATQFGL